MRTVTYDRYGGPETHTLRDDEPAPTCGELVLEVAPEES